MHSTDGTSQRMFDNFIENVMGWSLSYNHQAIYNRESLEMGQAARPQWPMWNIPYDPNFRGTPLFPTIHALYEGSRPCQCSN
jgi:hypothetical protein